MERYGVALLKNTRDAMVIEERAKKEYFKHPHKPFIIR